MKSTPERVGALAAVGQQAHRERARGGGQPCRVQLCHRRQKFWFVAPLLAQFCSPNSSRGSRQVCRLAGPQATNLSARDNVVRAS
jgi:hypothetical protein